MNQNIEGLDFGPAKYFPEVTYLTETKIILGSVRQGNGCYF